MHSLCSFCNWSTVATHIGVYRSEVSYFTVAVLTLAQPRRRRYCTVHYAMIIGTVEIRRRREEEEGREGGVKKRPRVSSTSSRVLRSWHEALVHARDTKKVKEAPRGDKFTRHAGCINKRRSLARTSVMIMLMSSYAHGDTYFAAVPRKTAAWG